MRTIVTRFGVFCAGVDACYFGLLSRRPRSRLELPAVHRLLVCWMVGPYNDHHGYSQAHYEAVNMWKRKIGMKMVLYNKVNTADRPGTTPDQLAGDLRLKARNWSSSVQTT